MIKSFQYKVYKPSTLFYKNRELEGDFEGARSLWPNTWGAWDAATVTRNASNAYPSSPLGRAAVYNGFSSFTAIPYQNANGLFSPLGGAIVWASKSNWQDGIRQALFSNDYIDGSNTCGWGIHINYSAGFVSAIAGIGILPVVYTEAKVSLTGLVAGFHQFAMDFDGTHLILYIDGAAVATTTVATTTINYGANSAAAAFIGAQKKTNGGSIGIIGTPSSTPSYFMGSVDFVATYIGSGATDPLPPAIVLANYIDHCLLETNCNYAYNFDYDTGSAAAELIVTNTGKHFNVTFAPGVLETGHSLKAVTSTGGGLTQGFLNATGGAMAIVNGNPYTASAWVKAPAGQTLTIAMTRAAGGETSSASFTATGAWQRIYLSYTFGASGLAFIKVSIYIGNANASVKTFYIDKIQVEDGLVMHDYFDRNTANGAGVFYLFDTANQVHLATFSTYTYVTTWPDVTSDFEYQQEVNSAGSEATIVLSRPGDNFGENVDVTFNNRVVVSVISNDYPNGQQIFTGYISRYTPEFGQDKVSVTVLGYGAEMDNYTISAGENKAIIQEDGSAGERGFNNTGAAPTYMGQGFTTNSDQANISAIEVLMRSDVLPVALDPTQPPYQQNITLKVWDSYANAITDAPSSIGGAKVPLAQATIFMGDAVSAWRKFTLKDTNGVVAPLRVNPNTAMFYTMTSDISAGSGEPTTVKVQSSAINPILGGSMIRNENGIGNVIYDNTGGNPFSDLAFRVDVSYGLTTAPFNSMDPGAILRLIIDDYNRQGGTLSYTASTIELTGTVVSYTFNTNSTLEGIKKCLELAPIDWYFYIDQSTNLVHFHNKNTASTRPIVFDRDIQALKFEKTTEGMVNQVIFTGGIPAGQSTNLFKKYSNTTSIALYGVRQNRYTDNRVTLGATADIIAGTLLGTRSFPEIRTEVEILSPYNLEIFRPGDLLIFRGFQSSGGSLYDIAVYDTDYYDFNLADPQTFILQIARFDYHPDYIKLTLSTTPPDVNKRIEDIKRQLDATATVANPVAPS